MIALQRSAQREWLAGNAAAVAAAAAIWAASRKHSRCPQAGAVIGRSDTPGPAAAPALAEV